MMRFKPFLAAAALLPLAAAVSAQSAAPISTDGLVEVDEMEVIGSTGDQIGEVGGVLVDPAGEIVALVIETEEFLGIGDEDVVVPLERLELVDGRYRVDMTAEELETLPKWRD